MQFPITIGLRRSRFLRRALVSTVIVATSMAMVMPWPLGFRAALILLVSIAACLGWRKFNKSPSAIRLEESGKILFSPADTSEFVEAELLSGATVHPWLTVARFKTAQGPLLLIVAVDTMKSDDFRRLRVFLQWRAEVSGEVVDAP